MWNGKNKAVTFSYDDGIIFDRQLVEILNRYGMKCTFNLNSGIQTAANRFEIEGKVITRMNMKELPKLYEGHEIASHTLTHPSLTELDEETIFNEVSRDIVNLENLFECDVVGMAYPYGTYSDKVVNILEQCGIKYARTVEATENCDLQKDLLRFRATCHHSDKKLDNIIDSFLNYEGSEPQLLYIWGHSYEFYVNENWELFESICSRLSGRDDIFYCTNRQAFGL